MYDLECLISARDQRRPKKASRPQNKRPNKNSRDKSSSIGAVSPKSTQVNTDKDVKVGGKEDVLALSAHVPPLPKSCPDPSPTDLHARKKHNAVPPQLLNADPLVQIIRMETIANVIVGDAKACVFLDTGATTDLMSLAYAQA